MLDVAKIKRRKHRTGGPRGWLKDRGNRPVTVERDRRGHAADFMSPEGSNVRASCLSGRYNLSQKERHCVLRHGAEVTRKGDGDKETKTWPEADTSGGPSRGTKGGRYQDQPQSLLRTSPRRSEGWNGWATPTWRQTAGCKKGRHPHLQRWQWKTEPAAPQLSWQWQEPTKTKSSAWERGRKPETKAQRQVKQDMSTP